MIYRRSKQIELDNQNDKLGKTVGNTAIGVVTAINPLIGAAAQGVRMIGDAMPRDEHGIVKNDFYAGIQGAFDPTSLVDSTISDFKKGDIKDGLFKIFNPFGGGIKERRDSLKEYSDKNHDTIEHSVGAFNPLAGRFSGNSVNVDKTIISNEFALGTNKGVNSGDWAQLANSTMQAVGSSKSKDLIKSMSSKSNKVDNVADEFSDAELALPDDMDSQLNDLHTESLFTSKAASVVPENVSQTGIESGFKSSNETESMIKKLIGGNTGSNPDIASFETKKYLDTYNNIDKDVSKMKKIDGLFSTKDSLYTGNNKVLDLETEKKINDMLNYNKIY